MAKNASPLSVAQRRTAIRMIASAHALLFTGFYYMFVVNFLNPRIKSVFKDQYTQQAKSKAVKMAILALLVIALPYMYAWSLMSYPCKMETYQSKFVTKFANDTDATRMELAPLACDVEDLIRSPLSLLIGPCAFIFFVGGFAGGFAVDWVCLQCGCSPLGGKMRMMLQGLMYPMLEGKLSKLFYHPTPLYFSLPACLWGLILIEMAIVSALTMSGVSLLVGIALGDIFLRSANTLLAPPDICILIIEGELNAWSREREFPGKPLWTRLRTRKFGAPAALEVSLQELEAVYTDMPGFRHLIEDQWESGGNMDVLNPYAGEDNEVFHDVVVFQDQVIGGSLFLCLWDMLWVQKVYIHEDKVKPVRCTHLEDSDDDEGSE